MTDDSFEAILCLWRERRRRCGDVAFHFIRIAAESLAEKQELILVPLAPFADQEMQPHSDADSDGERPIHGLGQQPRHVLAWWRDPNKPADDGSDD